MSKKVVPTNPEEEVAKGRIAVWLDPEDAKFIANEWRKIPENAPDNVREQWARVVFRIKAALHKSGIDYTPEFPDESVRYKTTT